MSRKKPTRVQKRGGMEREDGRPARIGSEVEATKEKEEEKEKKPSPSSS
jgi:hypothetical protein